MTECRLIFEVGTCHTDPDSLCITAVNSSFNDVLGFSESDLLGKPCDLILFCNNDLLKLRSAINSIRSGTAGVSGVAIDFKTKSGQKLSLQLFISTFCHHATPEPMLVCLAHDITELESVRKALLDSEERFRQMADMTGEWLWEQDPEGRYSYSSAAVESMLGLKPEEVIGNQYTELFADTAMPHILPEISELDKKTTAFFRLLNYYQRTNGDWVITESTGVPITDASGKLIKWRGVDRDVTAYRAAEEENRKAQVKLAVGQNEMKIARKIQESLLPSSPLVMPNLYVQGYCLPTAQVGGDYFDYFCRDSNTVDVVIADVSGHAVGSALFMVETRSALRIQAQMTSEPDETLFMMNRFLYEDLSQSDHFITMFYLQYNTDTRQLSYANAGHNLPLLLRNGAASCEPLDADGLVLGVKDLVCFERKQITLNPGDRLFLYTDGLTEAQDPEGRFFGAGRLCDLISRNAESSAEQLIKTCITELKDFREMTTFEDDLTMVVLQVQDDDDRSIVVRM